MLDWLIVGGGLHGVHLAHVLITGRGALPDRLAILDPHPQLLARWTRLTANTGMAYMRSPAVHHLDISPRALHDFAASVAGLGVARFRGPYDRPSYALFQAHAAHVIRLSDLQPRQVVSAAHAIREVAGGYAVETGQGELRSRRVVLAIGRTDLALPRWAAALMLAGAYVQHVFSMTYCAALPEANPRTVVVGGGITAMQVALAQAADNHTPVTLLMRHSLREANFDSDPGWMGPKYLTGFHVLADWCERRETIQRARNRGSAPPDVMRDLLRAQQAGQVDVVYDAVDTANCREGVINLHLQSGAFLRAERVVLATGFAAQCPGGAWLTTAIAALGLPCAPCGYPIVSASLQWRPGLYVMGPLAELEIGPVAGNIIGARMAAQRIARSATD